MKRTFEQSYGQEAQEWTFMKDIQEKSSVQDMLGFQ